MVLSLPHYTEDIGEIRKFVVLSKSNVFVLTLLIDSFDKVKALSTYSATFQTCGLSLNSKMWWSMLQSISSS